MHVTRPLSAALLLLATAAQAQSPVSTLPPGPAAPVAPATMNRDAEGRATVRAVRTPLPIRIDGRLDEAVYETVPPISGFIQTEPTAGAPSTEKTDAWVLFDDKAIYISFRCWETRVGRRVANEMRRDSTTMIDNDMVAFIFDTFMDQTSAAFFAVNSLGGRMDGQFSGTQYNGDWNPLWDARAGTFDGGWTAEIVMPFSSLRYPRGRDQEWGINLQRTIRTKNELSFLTRLGNARGPSAIGQMNQAGRIVGLQVPEAAQNIDVKPYASSNLTTDRVAVPPLSNDIATNVGLDVKYGVTQNLAADLTVNTDFAQVEADEQQVNLTRFSLFFPEKRDFFLENQGIFNFGIGGTAAGFAISPSTDFPVLFYSRRIGLQQGRQVPLRVGGRLTGRVGSFAVGAMTMQTGESDTPAMPGTAFSVLRLKRDVLRRSAIGAILTSRSRQEAFAGRNDVAGVDGLFNFYTNLSINMLWARSMSTDAAGTDNSYRAQLDYSGDRYSVQAEHLTVGAHFRPDMGFLRRADIRKNYGSFKFSPRPKARNRVRKYYAQGAFTHIENTAGRLEYREASTEAGIEFQTSDKLSVGATTTYEYIPRPFAIATGIAVPTGGYTYDNVRFSYLLARQRKVAGSISLEFGSLYGGDRTGVSFSRGRLALSTRLSLEPSININHVELTQGAFTNTLIGSRITETVTPRLFISALIQYNSGTTSLANNVRLRWEYQPGSELFIVYNDGRDTRVSGFPDLLNRSVIVKVNKLFRF
ncbi:MAG: DUF5916 domain-containing protein [Vicinamibacterales bacterium]|nr:DUF5916 domain-containing protein [Vicinamibacterales bacterium]